jgi:GNAT superfamily N-acetyltransferase
MKTRPFSQVILPNNTKVIPLANPLVDFYKDLYKSVGGQFNWFDRLIMPVNQLKSILESEKTEIQVLYFEGQTAGFVEYNIGSSAETEIVYFGLCADFRGKKLGYPFLEWSVNHAWERGIDRLWLHTCDLDHRAALPLYQQVGFEIFKEEVVIQPILD